MMVSVKKNKSTDILFNISCFICVIQINQKTRHPMNIPTMFGSNWLNDFRDLKQQPFYTFRPLV